MEAIKFKLLVTTVYRECAVSVVVIEFDESSIANEIADRIRNYRNLNAIQTQVVKLY